MARKTTAISPTWNAFERQLESGRTARQMGFAGKDGDVSRFLARHRVAACYRSSNFDGIAPRTARAYSSLIRLFLAWSAFEQLALATGLKPNRRLDYRRIDHLFEGQSSAGVGTDVLPPAMRPALAFLARVLDDEGLKTSLIHASSGKPGLTRRQLVVALRHAFAHGLLTAHFGGVRPTTLAKACDALSEWLLETQVRYFASVVGTA
jgi:hypothetical protein